MKEIPEGTFNTGFYIWFDMDKKLEFYSTPLYSYNSKIQDLGDSRFKSVTLTKIMGKDYFVKKSSKEVEVELGDIFSPYCQQFGDLLLDFLNTDFGEFQSAYNNFLYKYGFELLAENDSSEYTRNYMYLESKYVRIMESIYDNSRTDLMSMQSDLSSLIDFVYNLNGNEEYKDAKPISKFVASLVKRTYDTQWYEKDFDLLFDNYDKKFFHYTSFSLGDLIKKIDNDENFVKRNNVYTSTHLSSILFLTLEKIVTSENLIIKKCQNCGRYFIPIYRQSEVYCDFENIDGTPPCREKGALTTYNKNLKDNPALLKYRRTYQQKFMEVFRSGDDPDLKKAFEKWKKQAQEKIKQYKKGKITAEELYTWMNQKN